MRLNLSKIIKIVAINFKQDLIRIKSNEKRSIADVSCASL